MNKQAKYTYAKINTRFKLTLYGCGCTKAAIVFALQRQDDDDNNKNEVQKKCFIRHWGRGWNNATFKRQCVACVGL